MYWLEIMWRIWEPPNRQENDCLEILNVDMLG